MVRCLRLLEDDIALAVKALYILCLYYESTTHHCVSSHDILRYGTSNHKNDTGNACNIALHACNVDNMASTKRMLTFLTVTLCYR